MHEDIDMIPHGEAHSDITVTISSANTMADESGDSVHADPHQLQHQNLHIGLALLPVIHVDPVATMCSRYGSKQTSFYFSKDDTCAWCSHFKPDGSIVNFVTVPAQWADLHC
jgi:hypothetical protein